ncbi:hypothetical protein MTO96_034922 [Rhipicephalus appendiculatus]
MAPANSVLLLAALLAAGGSQAALPEVIKIAKQAHSPETAVCDFINPGDVDRLLIARYIRKRHPDARVAAGKCPRPLPLRGLPRADRALLLRLRIGCHHAAERMHRLTGRGSPFCADCGDTETLDHLLLHCSASSGARIKLLAAYAKHGLPRATAEHLLFPHCRQGDTKRVLSALLDFLEAAGLRHRL